MDYPSGTGFSFDYRYDARGALSGLTVNWPGTPATRAFKSGTYTRNLSGLRSLTKELYTGSTDLERDFQHQYDAQDRLVGENYATTSTYGSDGVVYKYDDAHNRTGKTVSGSTTTFNALRGSAQTATVDSRDEWTSFTDNGATGKGTWDARGNLTQWVVGTMTTTYVYDQRNRLVSKSVNGGSTVTQVYDAEGNRVSKTVGAITTSYLVDPQALEGYPEVVAEYTGSFSLQKTYLHGLRPIGEVTGSTAYYYVHDVLGNIRGKVNTSGVPSGTALTYDAYGNVEGTVPGGTSYGYTGEVWDADIGALDLRARWYLPRYGIFSQKDSFDGYVEEPISRNRVLYGVAGPINCVDPTGHEIEVEAAVESIEIGWQGARSVGVIGARKYAVAKVEDVLLSATLTLFLAQELGFFPGDSVNLMQARTRHRDNPTKSSKAYVKYKCDEFARDAKQYFIGIGLEAEIITYDSYSGRTVGDNINAVDGFGLFGGQNISINGHHEGVLVEGEVYDNNVPFGVPRRLWENGYEICPIDMRSNYLTLRQAHELNYGVIKPN